MQYGRVLTCCYCSAHTSFVPDRSHRATLACSACGAPLAAQKSMPLPGSGSGSGKPKKSKGSSVSSAKPKKAKSKKKKKKGLFSMVFDEALDALDDIFD